MDKEKIDEFYQIMDGLKTVLYGLKWLKHKKDNDIESVIDSFELLYKKVLTFGINNIG